MKKISLVLLAFIFPAIAGATSVNYSGVIPVFTINAGSMTVIQDDTAVRASTGALTVNLAAEVANRAAGDAAIGVTTAALNTAKLAKAGDTMTGALTLTGVNGYINAASTVTALQFNGSGAGLSAGSVPAASIAAGSLGAGVIASSVAVGAVQDAAVVSLTASKLSGALPAISGASLTSLTAANIAAGTLASTVKAVYIAPTAILAANIAATVPSAVGQLFIVTNAVAPYSICIGTSTAAGGLVLSGTGAHCQ